MRGTLTLSLFLLVTLCVNANMWDNLFLGKGIAFNIPKNFSMVLSYDGHIKFKILGSTDLHFLSVTVQSAPIEAFLADKPLPKGSLAFAKVNFGNGEMFVNSIFKDCLAVKDKAFDVDFFPRIHQYATLLTLLVSTTREGEYSKLETSKLLKMVDASALKKVPIDKIPTDKIPKNLAAEFENLNLVLFFDTKTSNLKKIELVGANKTYDLQVEEFKEYKFMKEDFGVPKEWKCNNQTLKSLGELNGTEIVNDIMRDRKAVLDYQVIPFFSVKSILNMFSDIKSFSELFDVLESVGKIFALLNKI